MDRIREEAASLPALPSLLNLDNPVNPVYSFFKERAAIIRSFFGGQSCLIRGDSVKDKAKTSTGSLIIHV
jgi:hypothetical protein